MRITPPKGHFEWIYQIKFEYVWGSLPVDFLSKFVNLFWVQDKLSAASTFAHHFPPSLGDGVGTGYIGVGSKMSHTFKSDCTFTLATLAPPAGELCRWSAKPGEG